MDFAYTMRMRHTKSPLNIINMLWLKEQTLTVPQVHVTLKTTKKKQLNQIDFSSSKMLFCFFLVYRPGFP